MQVVVHEEAANTSISLLYLVEKKTLPISRKISRTYADNFKNNSFILKSNTITFRLLLR